MNNEGTTKAPKDKNCPYCGQAFTSSSLGRHLDLYIKSKNPKAPDGIHDVDEIRKLRGSITRRQPRGGGRRDTSAPRSSHAGSKRSPAASEVDSVSARSPADAHAGTDAVRSPTSRRVFTRQMIKSSLDAKQRFQDALDTARASELALREMISSWRAAKQQIDMNSMPFDFSPLSLDFPALCLQCLEPPPTLFSSTPHPTPTSWSISPPGEKQKEALSAYFQEEFRKWKASRAAATTAVIEELPCPPSQAVAQRDNSAYVAQRAERAAEMLANQVTEHLASAFQAWKQLPAQRQQELWILQMARSISTKRKEVDALKETQHSLRQETANLRVQIDQLNRQKQPREFKIVPPMTMKVDEKMMELWTEAETSGRRVMDDHRSDLNAVVSGAIERWKSVILTARAASGMSMQRPLEESSAPLKTPISATHPMTPGVQQSAQHQQLHQGKHGQYQQSSPHAQSSIARNTSVSSGGPTASEPKTSAASTPVQSPMDSENEIDDDDDDDDADGDDDADADADADVEMEGEDEYLSGANASAHHTIAQIAQHTGPQAHQMHSINRSQDQHMVATRHSPYLPRANSYGNPGLLSSQQVHMSQQAFGHQMQSLEHHLAQGHGGAGMGWSNQ